ncbi:unnamed protein product [Paramecium primaurelia]|uniref:Uncharacterized protein n=1 Tax=Paramecium primaurelia TaxID=5886 RepID=A0A8S1MVM0_PARPR|nr:unnamed protein product [Paramecium primaurelia]
MYVSNKVELNRFTMDANLHDGDMVSKVNYLNSIILARNPKLRLENQKLFSDPTILGRYKNYRGASSEIANYIKNLDPIVRAVFVIDKSPASARFHTSRNLKAPDNLKTMIDKMNNFQKDDTGKKYFNQHRRSCSPRLKLPAVQRYYRNPPKMQVYPYESRTIDVDSTLSHSVHYH